MLDLKRSRDGLQKFRTKLDKDMAVYTETARKLLKEGKKDRARTVLRMKKYKQVQCQRVEGQLENVNNLIANMNSAEMSVKVFKALDVGNKELKRLNDELPIEKIQQLLDDTAESVAYQEEVSRLVSQSLTPEDEQSLNATLADLLHEVEIEEGVSLPDVPTTKPKIEVPKVVVEKNERQLEYS